jgi:hypothetical protein
VIAKGGVLPNSCSAVAAAVATEAGSTNWSGESFRTASGSGTVRDVSRRGVVINHW